VRVAYVTAGTVGAGHLVRGHAIGRALTRRGFAGAYCAFGPPVPYPVAATVDYRSVTLDPHELRDPARAAGSGVANALAEFRPDLLLVDLFWAPVRHVLPRLGCEAWLLLRTCPRAWFDGPPDTRFEPRQFRRIIAIEPFRHAAIRESVDPIVVCNPDECRPPGALRERLGVPDGQPLTVAMHAGLAGEIAQLTPDETTHRLDLFADDALVPVAEWLPGADRILCAAGYNAFWEARWLGYAGRTRFTPLPRKIDDQGWRVTNCAGYAMRANGADALAASILDGR
jgi:hypothetical protein